MFMHPLYACISMCIQYFGMFRTSTQTFSPVDHHTIPLAHFACSLALVLAYLTAILLHSSTALNKRLKEVGIRL